MNSQIIPHSEFLTQAVEEFQTQFPDWAKANNDRIQLAIAGVKRGAVTPGPKPETFIVASNSYGGVDYLVDRPAKSCTCPWYTFKGKVCTHRLEVHLAVRGMELQKQYEQECEIQRRKEQTQAPNGKSYIQRWINSGKQGEPEDYMTELEHLQDERNAPLSELWQEGTWDLIDGHPVHVCSDGYTGANIFGIGSELWCGRCNQNMPHTLAVREARVAYNYKGGELK